MCFLYISALCAGPDKQLHSAGLSASSLVGTLHVKRLQNQDFGKKAASLRFNRIEVLNTEGLGQINARTRHGETWEFCCGDTAGLHCKQQREKSSSHQSESLFSMRASGQ